MRLAFILVLAALMLPREMLKSGADVAYRHTGHLSTICEQYTEECRAAEEHATQAGLMIARVAREATYNMEDGVKAVLANLELARADGEPDRGTLNEQDLAPGWRGR